MKEIILIVLIIGLVIFFLYSFLKPQKTIKKDKAPDKDKKDESSKQEKNEIPNILKEVTMGNYMYDLSQNDVVDGIEMPEDESLDIQIKEEKDTRTKIEKAFDDIDEIGNDFEDDILDDYDDLLMEGEEVLFDDFSDNKTSSKVKDSKSIVDEYKGLSKEMKTILIANILQKKHK